MSDSNVGRAASERTVFVGLDYHQACVQVCVLDSAGRVLANGTCDNDAASIVQRVSGYGERVEAAIEACTGAASLADELTAAGWSVSQAHAAYVARLKQSPDKTDWQDARLLADLLRVGYLPRTWTAPPAIRELRRLVRYRQPGRSGMYSCLTKFALPCLRQHSRFRVRHGYVPDLPLLPRSIRRRIDVRLSSLLRPRR